VGPIALNPPSVPFISTHSTLESLVLEVECSFAIEESVVSLGVKFLVHICVLTWFA
jgi:hypothetical protein